MLQNPDRGRRSGGENHFILVGVGVEILQNGCSCLRNTLHRRRRRLVVGVRVAKQGALQVPAPAFDERDGGQRCPRPVGVDLTPIELGELSVERS